MRRLLLLLLAAVPLSAQSTEDALKARLLHQPLYLRQMPAADKLHFDAAGELLGKSSQTSFTLSGIEIQSVQLKPHELQLKGIRVGVDFVDKVPTRVDLKVRKAFSPGGDSEEIKLTLDAPAGGDYAAALNAIFAADLAALVPRMPQEWQSYGKKEFRHEEPADDGPKFIPGPGRKIGGGVSAPKVLFAPEPQYNNPARALRKSGNVLVYLQVDTAGNPVHLRILRPTGLGLDEQAILAVRQYKFQPSMENGKPVPVDMNVEVNFQVF